MLVRNSGPTVISPAEQRMKQQIFELKNALMKAHDEITQLKECFGTSDDRIYLQMMGFTPQQARMIAMLRKRDYATREQLMFAAYDGDDARRMDRDMRIVDVQIAKAKPLLKRSSIHVETIWGQGFHMPKKSKQAFDHAIERQRQAA